MDITKKIASFIYRLKYKDLSTEVELSVARSLIDSFGVAIAGSIEKSSCIVENYIVANKSYPTSSIIGGMHKTSPVDAALVNGVSLHALDYDDTGAYTQGHPSAPIFPAIIAVAEEQNSTGSQIIEAYVIGVEVLSRLSRSMPMMHLHGWHPTSVLGTIAATAAVAKLLNLNESKIILSLGIAGSLSSGLVNNFGTMTKHLQVGNAASNGILAAKLASRGFTSNSEMFDSDMGFHATFWKDENELLMDQINSFGEPLAIINPGINIKKYPSCALSHRVIDGILKISKKHELDVNKTANIYCKVSPRAVKILKYNNPLNELEARFSLPFVVACALLYKDVNLSHFTTEILNDDRVQFLISKVSVIIHENWVDGDDAKADIVEIVMQNGAKFSESVLVPTGNVKNPLSMEEIFQKFNECTNPFISEKSQGKILDLCLNLSKQSNINQLMELVTNYKLEEIKC